MCQIVDRGISIHALLAESDSPNPVSIVVAIIFLSTLSLRRATRAPPYNLMIHHNFYPRSPCGERPGRTGGAVQLFCISIHALLAESDVTTLGAGSVRGIFLSTLSLRRATRINRNIANGQSHFYPRSPCGERPAAWRRSPSMPPFLSTLSLRRATRRGVLCYLDNIDFYPRSPCGERLVNGGGLLSCFGISIHALLAESDYGKLPKPLTDCIFLSTLSLRRATSACWRGCWLRCNFYPRSPCGERHDFFGATV